MLTRTHVLSVALALTASSLGCAHHDPIRANTGAEPSAAIRSVEVPALTVAPGETVPLHVYAQGAEPLRYTWSVSSGKLLGADKPLATLVAPSTEGAVRVEIVVTDRNASTARLDVELAVDRSASVALAEETDPFQPKPTHPRALARK